MCYWILLTWHDLGLMHAMQAWQMPEHPALRPAGSLNQVLRMCSPVSAAAAPGSQPPIVQAAYVMYYFRLLRWLALLTGWHAQQLLWPGLWRPACCWWPVLKVPAPSAPC